MGAFATRTFAIWWRMPTMSRTLRESQPPLFTDRSEDTFPGYAHWPREILSNVGVRWGRSVRTECTPADNKQHLPMIDTVSLYSAHSLHLTCYFNEHMQYSSVFCCNAETECPGQWGRREESTGDFGQTQGWSQSQETPSLSILQGLWQGQTKSPIPLEPPLKMPLEFIYIGKGVYSWCD